MPKGKIIINGKEYEVDVRLGDATAFTRDLEPVTDLDDLLTVSITTPWISGTNPDPRWIPVAETLAGDDTLAGLLDGVIVEPPKLVMLISGENLSPEFLAWLNGDEEAHE